MGQIGPVQDGGRPSFAHTWRHTAALFGQVSELGAAEGQVADDPNRGTSRPTKEECLERFWDIMAEGLVDLHRNGKLDDEQEPSVPIAR